MHDNSNRRTAWVMRAFLPLAAAALAACSDDQPTQPKANLPASGPAKPSAVIHIIPEGTTFPTKIAFATGNPAGKEAMVKLYDKDGKQITAFLAFGTYADFSAGVDAAVGDVNGDGWPDIIAGEGATPPGTPSSKISIWDGKTGTWLQTITPFNSTFTNGVRVAAGDLDGDGKEEILACTGAGGGGNQARAFHLGSSTWMPGTASEAFINNFPRVGGCHIAAGDYSGDGIADEVIVWDGPHNVLTVKNVKAGFEASFGSPMGWEYSKDIDVAMADVNGDGHDDILLSFLRDSAVVRAFDGAQVKLYTPLTMLKELKPMWDTYGGGLHIATHDLDGDGKKDLLYKQNNRTLLSYWATSFVFARYGPTFTTMPFWFEEPGHLAPSGPIG
jgi:FG-GAP-like repeat